MKKSISLRAQLFGLMALLVLLQSLSLAAALSFSKVYFMLDAEAFRLIGSAVDTRVQSYNELVGALVGGAADTAGAISGMFNRLSGGSAADVYLDDKMYLEAMQQASSPLMSLLRGYTVSGGFLILRGSNADKSDPDACSALYIRNSAPSRRNEGSDSFLLELGPTAVSQAQGIPTSVRWDLDISITRDNPAAGFFWKPMDAAAHQPDAELERYGYWSPPVDFLQDGQQDVVYTLPLLDSKGEPFGVIGFEISLSLFNQYYLPNSELPYQNSFFAIAPVSGDAISLDWFIPSGPIAQVYLGQEERLDLKPVEGGDSLYGVTLTGLGEMYCLLRPLTLYSRNSPFSEEVWSLVSMVPQDVLHETSQGVRSTLVITLASTTLVCIAAIFLLVYMTTRKISGLSAYVQSLSPHMDIGFAKTGIREIDELTAAVEMLNKSVVNASKTTSKILELTLLPIGGYEVNTETRQVVLTEYIYALLGLDPAVTLSREEWEEQYRRLVAAPANGYEDIYKLEQGEDVKWLRILETETATGRVGVILDVTRDIEENRRLAHELDYDALTRLLNRTAFKREAHLLIRGNPHQVGAMIFTDLDNLKYMNDTFGHDMGDRLIMRAGEMFRTFERHGGVVSRISGDEFAIYLHGFASKNEARRLIYDQYRENDNYSLNTPDGSLQKIRSSSGIAFYPEDSDNVTDLLKLADFAMYEAKHNRKGAIYEFSRESYQNKAYLFENREAINRLLDEGLIRFAFQPIVDLKTGGIYAYEALMRPLLDNFKSPLEILSVAAAQSKLGHLERLVMVTAFRFAREHEKELNGAKLFLNSIPSQTLSEEDHKLLEEQYADLFDRIVIEITEAENDAPEHMRHKIEFIRQHGIGLAVDDYGSGYSNEVRIMAFSPDIVKIDMELISGIDQNTDKRMLVGNLAAFCHSKSIRLVAEGVETRGELAALIGLGVDYVQGYYIMRPQQTLVPIPQHTVQEILDLGREHQSR